MEITRRKVPEAAATLGAAGIAPVMARIFASRGIASTAELDNDLVGLPPWQTLKGIAAASERLACAIERGERLLIVADYDADGATACAVGMRGLAAMGATVEFLVPNRFEFGYGLTP
jgi:single-stranded-DNA-specific exonuclease